MINLTARTTSQGTQRMEWSQDRSQRDALARATVLEYLDNTHLSGFTAGIPENYLQKVSGRFGEDILRRMPNDGGQVPLGSIRDYCDV